VRRLAYLLILAGVAVLATIPLSIIRSDRHAAAAQTRLAKQFGVVSARQHSSAPEPSLLTKTQALVRTTPTARPVGEPSSNRANAPRLRPEVWPPLPGGVLDKLVIPTIGLSRYVVQGTAESDLAEGPGHYVATPLPGQYGNVAIAGHRTTYGAPFWALNELTRGDRIFLTDPAGHTWIYRVTGHLVVAPEQLSVIGPLKGYYLTLTTCNPRFWATGRLVVRAELQRPSPVR